MIIAVKLWVGLVVIVMSIYTIRHLIFAYVRLYLPQHHAFQDIAGAYLPTVCVLVPMHNELAVVDETIRTLKRLDYPAELLDVLIVDDRSTDGTSDRLDELCAGSRIRIFHRKPEPNQITGKPAALNDALLLTDADVLLTFDADYWPSRDSVMRLVAPLADPRVALTMGRVVPRNPDENLLTRMLDLERAGGYQVNQQVRQTLDLMPQYGGTVGAIRRAFLTAVGGWNPTCLAEDTYLTVLAYIHGLKVAYVNLEETTEEVPVLWSVRQKQLRRWVIGHNQVALRLGRKLWRSPFLTIWQKIDATLLLSIYGATVLLMTGYIGSVILLLMNESILSGATFAVLILTAYSTLGNSAAFIEIAVSAVVDGRPAALWGLPVLVMHFTGSTYVAVAATLDWLVLELGRRRQVAWEKTERTGGGRRGRSVARRGTSAVVGHPVVHVGDGVKGSRRRSAG
ncbi:MAG: glycosyltransferase family 2 protein [Mycobacterium leprae]